MIVDKARKDQSESSFGGNRSQRSIHEAQEIIYSFLLDAVKHWPVEEVLAEFKRLFIEHIETISSTTIPALYEIVFANNELEFRNTLKRACYILINNWGTKREHQAIQDLVQLFEDPLIQRRTVSPTLRRLRGWLNNFIESKDYQDLKLFAAKYDKTIEKHWTERYTSYLLVSQYVDTENPVEQREAARALAQQLKDKFKFDLAMYTAKSQSGIHRDYIPDNPTGLGDEVLRLIKMIVMRRGTFSYMNLANIFIKQTDKSRYKNFKLSLQKYLAFALPKPEIVQIIQTHLSSKLDELYVSYHDDELTSALLLRTCNRIIEYLTTEDRQTPSQLFCLLLSQGNPLPLVSILLKIVLICRNSRTHLEARFADLIRYYEDFSQEDCQWVITFFEVFKITFAIYTENIEYSLVRTRGDSSAENTLLQANTLSRLETYRIFSQLKREEAIAEDLFDVSEDELNQTLNADDETEDFDEQTF